MIPLTNKDIKSYEKQNVCHICKKKFCYDKNKKKVRDHCHYTGKFGGAAHSECNLRHKVPKEISVVFHNGSTYDYHFMINQLVEEFEGEFECLGENTEKYITFSVPLKFMERKNIRLNCYFIRFKNGRLNYKSKECKKSYTKLTNESIKHFLALYKFCNSDLNKFFLLLRKGICPDKYMDSWGRFDENTIPPKEAFYSKLDLEGISDADYEHVKKV